MDQNAYLVGGRLIAEHHTTRYVLPVLPDVKPGQTNPGGFAYTGGMFVRMPNGDYFPKYPFGLPLLYAAFFWAFGPDKGPVWAFVVSPASATLAVLGTFFLARTVAGSFAAVMAAILLGTSQVMLSLADNPNSHAACTACIVWGMFLLVRWWQTGSLWQGALAGLLVGYAFTIRYTEGLLVIPVAIACLTRVRWRHWAPWTLASAVGAAGVAFMLLIGLYTMPDWADVHGLHHYFGPGKTGRGALGVAAGVYAAAALAFVGVMTGRGLHRAWLTSFLRNVLPGLAWCVPVVTLLVYNSVTMGHAAGYDTTHESELGVAFKWSYLVRNWEMVVRTFDDLELFFVVPFALAGLALVFRRSWRVGVLLLSWLVPGVLLYTSYYWSMDFDVAYARFYLTFLPALCRGGGRGVPRRAARRPRGRDRRGHPPAGGRRPWRCRPPWPWSPRSCSPPRVDGRRLGPVRRRCNTGSGRASWGSRWPRSASRRTPPPPPRPWSRPGCGRRPARPSWRPWRPASRPRWPWGWSSPWRPASARTAPCTACATARKTSSRWSRTTATG